MKASVLRDVAAPPVQGWDDAVLFQGAVTAELSRALVATVRMQRRDGIEPSELLQLALAALIRAAEHRAQAGRGTTEARGDVDSATSYQDEISIEEAVEMIKRSPEYVRRLAREGRLGLSRKVGNRRRFSRAGVLAYLDDRTGQ